jgi:hypothetical protein
MAQHMIQVPSHIASEIESYLKDTLAGGAGEVERDGSIVTIDQDAYDALAALPSDADGHIDDGGNLWIDGADYQVGRL